MSPRCCLHDSAVSNRNVIDIVSWPTWCRWMRWRSPGIADAIPRPRRLRLLRVLSRYNVSSVSAGWISSLIERTSSVRDIATTPSGFVVCIDLASIYHPVLRTRVCRRYTAYAARAFLAFLRGIESASSGTSGKGSRMRLRHARHADRVTVVSRSASRSDL